MQITIKNFILLHAILFLYSLNGIFSKTASNYSFFTVEFIFYYGLIILNLFIYALLWQQILKRMPLTTAFANKAIIIVWGMIWGNLIFSETITINMILGAIIIFYGIYMVVTDNE